MEMNDLQGENALLRVRKLTGKPGGNTSPDGESEAGRIRPNIQRFLVATKFAAAAAVDWSRGIIWDSPRRWAL